MEAASRRAERQSQRRHRQLVRDQIANSKLQAQQQAAYDVEVYENQIERIQSVHKDCPSVWDWNGILNTPPPVVPDRKSDREIQAQAQLEAFKPGMFDRLFGQAVKKRQALEQAITAAKLGMNKFTSSHISHIMTNIRLGMHNANSPGGFCRGNFRLMRMP